MMVKKEREKNMASVGSTDDEHRAKYGEFVEKVKTPLIYWPLANIFV
jgi:hypothetical protein